MMNASRGAKQGGQHIGAMPGSRFADVPDTLRQYVQLAVCLWLMLATTFAAADIPSPSPVDERAEHTPTLWYIADTTRALTFDKLADQGQAWQKAINDTGNFGYLRAVFWFRIDLINTSSQVLDKVLHVEAPFLDQIEYQLLHDGHLIASGMTGDYFPFQQRPIAHPNFLFPVTLTPGDTYTYLFRVTEAGPMEFPVSLWNEREFYLHDAITAQLNSFYYGILLFVILFNSLIYLVMRERTHLYYVLFITSLLLFQSTLHGRSFAYLWPDVPALQYWLVQLNMPLSILFGSLFAQSFLRIQHHSPRLNIAFRISIASSLACLAMLPFVNVQTALMLSALLTLPCSLLLLITGPILWWQGVKEAAFFTIAWFGLAIGILATMLYKLGVLPEFFLTTYGVQIGSGIEATLLSLAIADRIYRERSERLAAHARSIKEAEERLNAERQLVEQATHSPVTGLPNRVFFENRMRELMALAEDQTFMVCLIHLSRFHEIDKTLGHENADRLLRQIATRLNTFCSALPDSMNLQPQHEASVCLASIEGVIMGLLLKLPVLPVGQGASDEPGISLQGLLTELHQRVQFDHLTLDPGAVAGIVRYPADATDLENLMRKAHIALDMAAQSQAHFASYDESFDNYNERRLTLMAELDKAIAEDALTLHFQPQLDLKQNRIIGVETLLRWQHPEYGFISPDEFITLAEQTGLITPLTRWVIWHTLMACTQLTDLGFDLQCSINISAINLKEPDFAQRVGALLAEFKLSPHRIMLELTETAMMDDPDGALAELYRLRKVGVQLSIDDFGTGYSSLSYIRKLPIDEIKIDRSLVFDLTRHKGDQVIVKTTLEMAQNLGYGVVAEGVENQDMLDILNELDCDIIQGYFIARPMPLSALVEWLRERDSQDPRPEAFRASHTRLPWSNS